MADATAEFFDELGRRGHEPLLEKAACASTSCDGQKTDRWLVSIDKGDVAVSRRNAPADCVVAADKALFDGLAAASERDGGAAARRDGRRGRLRAARALPAALPRPGPRERSGAADSARRKRERRPRQDPRRQHLRRQRRARRHRGVAHRPDRALLVRHPLPLEVGADGERRAAEPALGRRPAVLRDALLPRAGHRDGLRRREAVGDPPARGRRRLPRGADDPQPRRRSRST